MPFVCGQTWTGSTRSSPLTELLHDRLQRARRPRQAGPRERPGHRHPRGHAHRQLRPLRRSSTTAAATPRSTRTSTSIVTPVGTVLDQGDLIGYLGTTGQLHRTAPALRGAPERRLLPAVLPPARSTRSARTRTSANCIDRPIAGDWDGDGTSRRGRLPHAPPRPASSYLRTATDTVIRPMGSGATRAVGRRLRRRRVSQLGRTGAGERARGALRSRDGRAATVTGVGTATDIPVDRRLGRQRARPTSASTASSTQTFYLSAREQGRLTAVQLGRSGRPARHRRLERRPASPTSACSTRTTGTWTLRVPSGSRPTSPRRDRYGAWVTCRSPATGTATESPTSASGVPRTADLLATVPRAGGRSAYVLAYDARTALRPLRPCGSGGAGPGRRGEARRPWAG